MEGLALFHASFFILSAHPACENISESNNGMEDAMNKKVAVGMRVSTRRDGKGTVLRSNAGTGWFVQFDNGQERLIMDWNLWNEAGDVSLSG